MPTRLNISKYLLTASAFISGFFYTSAHAQSEALHSQSVQVQSQSIQVGVLATRGHAHAIETWQPTLDWLSQELPQYKFELQPLDLIQIRQGVADNSLSFVITNPGQAVILGREYPLSWIATLKGDWPQGTTEALGSSLVVPYDSDIQSVEDLKGKKAVAVSPNAFGGFLILKRKLANLNAKPESLFSEIQYLGFPLDELLLSLTHQEADVAIAPACLLEEMQSEGSILKDTFRVIDNQAPTGFPCAVSTQLYPNWSFARTSLVPDELATQIAKALLEMPSDSPAAKASKSLGWASPISPYMIDRMYQELAIHPLQRPWWQQGLIWVKEHQAWGWAAFVLFLSINLYHLLLEWKFSRSKRELTKAHQALNQKTQMLEHAQRITLVGELGSSLAHEINQPLAAIRNYSQAAKIKLDKGASAAQIQNIIDKIDSQVSRVDNIVSRLRTLIKKRPVDMQEADIIEIFNETYALLAYQFEKHQIPVRSQIIGKPYLLTLDKVGITQVLINILNNALDACIMCDDSHISHQINLSFDFSTPQLVVKVQDTGVGLPKDSQATQAFYTTKEKGLGMGLSICQDILEKHHAKLNLAPATPRGCCVSIIFAAQTVRKAD